MAGKTKSKTAVMICVAAAVVTLASGCTFHGDTSGFKPEQKPSKAEINQQIAQIKSNPKIPGSVRDMALKKLQQDLVSAR